jgi:hypothetical protein
VSVEGGPRPAPQYGEYATPEEQAERIRLSGGEPAASAVPPTVVPVEPAPLADPPVAEPTARPRPDRFITIAMLAYGLVTVVTTIPQLIDFSSFAQTWLDMAGIQAQFTQTELGRQWGIVSAVLFAVGWLATAAFSWYAIATRRLSWWIPAVGALVTFTLVSLCLSVPLVGDPAVMDAVLRAA